MAFYTYISLYFAHTQSYIPFPVFHHPLTSLPHLPKLASSVCMSYLYMHRTWGTVMHDMYVHINMCMLLNPVI